MFLVKTYLDISPIHGIGVFAAEPIPAGTAVARYVAGLDRCFERTQVETLPEDWQTFLRHYGFSIASQPDVIYCSLDNDRFVNHSETPNLDDSGSVSLAIRDIAVGEELTTNYRVLCEVEAVSFGDNTPTSVPEPAEYGGRSPDRPAATRYGDWEKDGRCVDF